MTTALHNFNPATERLFKQRCEHAPCRSCRHRGLVPILDLGPMPLSDGFLPAEALAAVTARYPLEFVFCPRCSLVQILETVPPETLFGDDYPYYSSFSDTLLAHSQGHARDLVQRRGLTGASLVVELASNDGYLLKYFVECGIPVLGIDPAQGPAEVANDNGVHTIHAFFTNELADELRAEGKQADVIIANNVLAHVADTNGFVRGICTLLRGNGVAVLEFPYVRDLIDRCEFDTIYHEHLCYFSLHAVDRLFRNNGLYVNEVRRLPIHGGSLRIYAGVIEDVQRSVIDLLAEENTIGLTRPEYYEGFAEQTAEIRQRMRSILRAVKDDGKRIAAYGAAAKGTILLNFIGVDQTIVEFAVDRNVHKQGKYIPGVNIPIVAPEELLQRMPDYTIILPWNLRDEILEQQTEYRDRGGRFIVPIPRPQIIQ